MKASHAVVVRQIKAEGGALLLLSFSTIVPFHSFPLKLLHFAKEMEGAVDTEPTLQQRFLTYAKVLDDEVRLQESRIPSLFMIYP